MTKLGYSGRWGLRALKAVLLALCLIPFVGLSDGQAEKAPDRFSNPKSSVVIGVLPLVSMDERCPAGAGNSLRDVLASEISRQAFISGKSISSTPVTLENSVEFSPVCPLKISDLSSSSKAEKSEELDANHPASTPLKFSMKAGGDEVDDRSMALEKKGRAYGEKAQFETAENCAGLALRLAQKGMDEVSQIALRQSAILSPVVPMALESKSRRFFKGVQRVRDEIRTPSQETVGSLLIMPLGGFGFIHVDGVKVGSGNLKVDGLLPGYHLIQIIYPGVRSVQTFTGIVESGRQKRIQAPLQYGDPLGKFLAAIGGSDTAENRGGETIDEFDDLRVGIETTTQVSGGRVAEGENLNGVSAGASLPTQNLTSLAARFVDVESMDFLVGGTLANLDDDLVFSGFVYNAESGAICTLGTGRFDGELLGAGLAAAPVVREVLKIVDDSVESPCLPFQPEKKSEEFTEIWFPKLLASMEKAHSKSGSAEQSGKPKNRERRLASPGSDIDSQGESTPEIRRRPIDPRRAAGALRDRKEQ